MKKTILITGSTDGIGYETAKKMLKQGHNIIIHGRNEQKIQNIKKEFESLINGAIVDSFTCDLSNIDEVKKFIHSIKQKYSKLDILINNAGVYKTKVFLTKDNLDIRFVVNTITPYFLTKELIPLFDDKSRVVNLSSAAQAPVSLEALKGISKLGDSEVYAQSKLALTMWTNYLAEELKEKIGVIVSVNPASFLGSKMVKDAYGMEGKDISIGVDILVRASLSDEFEDANGKYFDNDINKFSNPHLDALDMKKCKSVVDIIENILY